MSGKAPTIKRAVWDGDFALLEAENTEEVFTLHLRRCDDRLAAEKIASVFSRLALAFEKKKIDLEKKMLER